MNTTSAAIPVARSLRDAALAAQQLRQPLVLMFSLTSCPFCDVVHDNYLSPLVREGKVQAVLLNLRDRDLPLLDWQGQSTTHADMAKHHRVRMAPTLLFADAKGRELTKRLVGMSSVDFYGVYLDERLDQARRALL